MTPRQAAAYRRAATVAAADIAACAIAAMAMAATRPVMTLGVLAGLNVAAALAVPVPGMAWAGRLARKALRAVRAWRHARWVSRMSLVAQAQKDARHSHPDNCFCTCGIDRAALAWFRDGMERTTWEMQQERDRRRHQ